MNNAELDKKIKQIIHSKRFELGYVCMVDILKGLGYLSNKDYENWRFGRTEYLEKVCNVNFSKLTFINKLFKRHSLELGLKGSWTACNQHGIKVKKGLKFSKSGKSDIEKSYSTHYIDKERILELKNNKSQHVTMHKQNAAN